MRVVIVDDEQPARERLKHLLDEIEDFEFIAEAGNGHDAISVCAKQSPDIILMDIRMPGMDGVEAARHLSTLDQPPAVIFTTAYDEYAVDAFDAQAIGYLMKPIRRERLQRALKHASRLSRPQLTALADADESGGRRNHICARVRDELRLIPIEDVLYFRADQKYVTVKHRSGEVLIDESLKSLAEEFALDFVRVHRNAVVSVKAIETVERDTDGHYLVRLKSCDESLAVSRRHAADLRRRIRGGK